MKNALLIGDNNSIRWVSKMSESRRWLPRRKYPMYERLLIFFVVMTGLPAHGADVFNGRTIYDMHCQACHGADGRSMVAGTPDFSSGDVLFQPDTELFKQIREGKRAMPAYRGILNDDEIRDVIAYLRSLPK